MTIETASEHLPFQPGKRVKYDHQMRIDALVTIVKNLYEQISEKEADQFRILDMSCGRGELSTHLVQEGFNVVGVDADETCVQISKEKGLTVFRSDYPGLIDLFSESEFDLVISSHALEHLENPKQEVKHLIFVAKKHIILAVPNPLASNNIFYSMFGRIGGVQSGHHYIWDHRHFKNFLENHLGLKILSWHSDFVRVFTRKRGIRKAMQRIKIVRPFEMALAKLIPFFGISIIVLCEKKQ